MDNAPLKKVVTHRFEPTSKYVLLFIGGLALSLVISIWGNLAQMARVSSLGGSRLEISGIEDGSSIWRPKCSIHRKAFFCLPR